MTPQLLLTRLRSRGVKLIAKTPGQLKVDAPKGVITPSIRAALLEHKQAILVLLRAKSTVRNEFNELNEFNRRKQSAKSKVWRPSPYWQACLAATRAEGVQAAQQLYAALAIKYGHTPEEASAQLDALVPHVHRHRSDPLLRSQWADAYVAAHPYAWELKLNASDYYEAVAA